MFISRRSELQGREREFGMEDRAPEMMRQAPILARMKDRIRPKLHIAQLRIKKKRGKYISFSPKKNRTHDNAQLGDSHLSEDAGLFRRKKAASPWSFLAEAMASLIAKNAEDAMKNGGSPTAWETYASTKENKRD